jgi:hypothetical protein
MRRRRRHKTTPPLTLSLKGRGDKKKSRPKGGFVIQTLDPGFRRGDEKEKAAKGGF